MRFAVDTGGTFTDLVVESDDGGLRMYKAPTTPSDPVAGVLETLARAADDLGESRESLLGRGEMLIHGTTHAINAIVTGNTARMAFLTTKGHPDVLVFREGGRTEPFNFTVPYPEPYVPRSLTYEVPERVAYDGTVTEPLDEAAIIEIIEGLKQHDVEAVGVCLLWSIVNPAHELRVGALLERHLPGVPYTLSHVLNPSLREYRRASSTCIDASLKPLMGDYLGGLESRLRGAGFGGRVLVVTTQGGAMDAADMAHAPIHSINSGPAMAPIAGRAYAQADSGVDTAIIADTGGTTFDVSLVRGGRIPWTRETWIGQPYRGHMTGFPAVDVKSIGAGGGSIAWVDEGGLLHVGPKSAGAVPGPVCYGAGGTEPTVTDASVILGWIDPAYFLGGTMALETEAAAAAIESHVAGKLGLSLHEAAAAIMSVATENMVHAIEDITVNQGIDPREAAIVGGGGAAGLNAVAIARRLGCAQVILPEVAAALSAHGALISELRAEYSGTLYTSTGGFDFNGVNALLEALEDKCRAFIQGPGAGSAGAGRGIHGGSPLSQPDLGDRGAVAFGPDRGRAGARGLHRGLPQDPRSAVHVCRQRVDHRDRRLARQRALPSQGRRQPERGERRQRTGDRAQPLGLFLGHRLRRSAGRALRRHGSGGDRGRAGNYRIVIHHRCDRPRGQGRTPTLGQSPDNALIEGGGQWQETR